MSQGEIADGNAMYSTGYPNTINIRVRIEAGPSRCQGPTRFDTATIAPIPLGSEPILAPWIAEPQG